MKNALGVGESLGPLTDWSTDDFKGRTVLKDGEPTADTVLLEVKGQSDHCVYLGDNPIRYRVIEGFGRLSVMNIDTAEFREHWLEPGSSGEVNAREAYFYERCGLETLVLRDDCEGFDPADEPSVAEYFPSVV